MILYYALGGGLGHFTRATTFVFTLQKQEQYSNQQYLILHNVPKHVLEDAVNLPPNTTTVQLSAKECASTENVQNALKAAIESFQVTEIYIDTFPLGLRYELAFLETTDIPKNLVTRIIKAQYFDKSPKQSFRFEKIYHVEPLPQYQMAYLEQYSNDVSPLTLIDFSVKKEVPSPILSANTWLIVHSGPSEEVMELYQYALDNAQIQRSTPNFLIVSPTTIALDIPQIAFYPAKQIYPQAAKIITACGYNSMLDTLPFADKHLFLPFERRFDDQFLRASMRRNLK